MAASLKFVSKKKQLKVLITKLKNLTADTTRIRQPKKMDRNSRNNQTQDPNNEDLNVRKASN